MEKPHWTRHTSPWLATWKVGIFREWQSCNKWKKNKRLGWRIVKGNLTSGWSGGLLQEAEIWIKHSGQRRSEPCGTQTLFQAENTMVQRQERFDVIWVWTWHLNKIFETIQQKPKVSQSFEQVRSSSHYLQRVNSFQLSTWDPDSEVLLTGSMGTSGLGVRPPKPTNPDTRSQLMKPLLL